MRVNVEIRVDTILDEWKRVICLVNSEKIDVDRVSGSWLLARGTTTVIQMGIKSVIVGVGGCALPILL